MRNFFVKSAEKNNFMKIAILGGGFTGLTASYYLAKKGYRVFLFEKENVLGGLASGFKTENWKWSLERTYHHLFTNDDDILEFMREIKFNNIFFQEPITASLYEIPNSKLQLRENIYRIIPLDNPQSFLRFPLLSYPKKIRAAIVLAFLKFSPHFSFYEKQTAEEFLRKTMGESVWNILWQELFRKKFGKYAENILASFIWARINKRTKKLGYIKGGFQALIDFLSNRLTNLGVDIKTGYEIKEIKKRGEKFLINNQLFDKVISTLPTAIMVGLTKNIFPAKFLQKFRKLKYLHALTLILESEKPLLDKTYWLNVSAPLIPIMAIVQHTNFVDKKYYGNRHICYLGWYVDEGDKLWLMDKKEIFRFVLSYLKKINPHYSITQLLNYYLFKSPFAQPIFDKDFVMNKPDFKTPLKNFYIANLDMTYPYDRGTNYAVKLGKEVSQLL